MATLLEQIFSLLDAAVRGQAPFSSKAAWNGMVKGGTLPIDPLHFKAIVTEVVRKPENGPRGAKLMERRQATDFTLRENGLAHRPEEGLERLIVLSNKNVYNQVPVGGGKEAVDLMHVAPGGESVFIELKPWASGASPLYALAECLKNLELYRIIREHGLNNGPLPSSLSVAVLAPEAYYSTFGLPGPGADFLSHAAALMARAHETDIRFLSLRYDRNEFDECCRARSASGRTGHATRFRAEDATPIPALQKKNWREIIRT